MTLKPTQVAMRELTDSLGSTLKWRLDPHPLELTGRLQHVNQLEIVRHGTVNHAGPRHALIMDGSARAQITAGSKVDQRCPTDLRYEEHVTHAAPSDRGRCEHWQTFLKGIKSPSMVGQ